MLKEGERWRVYDVTLGGVSLVSNYRTQFNRIIQQSGYDELLKNLRSKQKDPAVDKTAPGEKQP